MYLYERFVVRNEKPLDLLSDPSNWKKVMLFRSKKGPTVKLSNSAMYEERVAMFRETETPSNGSVNHLERKLGALYAQLVGLSSDQIERIGLWATTTLTRHYGKLFEADAVARLSGAPGAEYFYIGRARASVQDFIELHGGQQFFSSFFPFLFDEKTCKSVKDLAIKKAKMTPYYTLETLKFLHSVFFQDCVFLYERHPKHAIFRSHPFVEFGDVFTEWSSFVKAKAAELPFKETSMPGRVENARIEGIEAKVAEIYDAVKLMMARQNDILSALSTKQVHATGNKKAKLADSKDNDSEILQTLTALNELTIEDMWEEWTVGFTSQGRVWEPLKELERKRIDKVKQYRMPCLRSAIERRSIICKFVENKAVLLGSVEAAIQYANRVKASTGQKGKPLSNFKFSDSLRPHVSALN